MREIKFRAWIKKESRMAEVQNLSQNGKSIIVDDSDMDGTYNRHFGINKYELMQYTGLKDKNGNEIYDGDIVNWKDSHLEVRWGSVGWILFGKLFKKFGFPIEDGCNEVNTKGYIVNSEIIGNIHENPELLKTS